MQRFPDAANIVNLCSAFSVKKLCYVSSIATLGYNPERIDEETHWSGNQDQSVYANLRYDTEYQMGSVHVLFYVVYII